jgi:hypothetical protein
MKLKIKEEHLDTIIFCPFTKKNISMRFIEENMYVWYSAKGYSNLFEEDKPIQQKQTIKQIKPTDDLSESRD